MADARKILIVAVLLALPSVGPVAAGEKADEAADFFGGRWAQVRVVPAAAFQPARSGMRWELEGEAPQPSQLRTLAASSGSEYHAAVDLPSGLRISELKSYFLDADDLDLSLQLWQATGTGAAVLLGAVASSSQPGETTAASTLDHRIDNAGNGQLFLRLTLPTPLAGELKFREAVLVWKREIKDYKGPPCTPYFGDVPCIDGAFNEIEAIRRAGITGGCSESPPLYCPDANVTRGQMAVFLAKALGLYWAF